MTWAPDDTADPGHEDLPEGSSESPCTSVCQLDADELCIGCGRSVDEIMGWTRMSAAEKAATNRRAADRRRTMGISADPG